MSHRAIHSGDSIRLGEENQLQWSLIGLEWGPRASTCAPAIRAIAAFSRVEAPGR